jgi:hypothetical protein
VVHVHPHFTVLLTTLGQLIKPMGQEGIQLARTPLTELPHFKAPIARASREPKILIQSRIHHMIPSRSGHGVFLKNLVVQFDPQAWFIGWNGHVAVGKDLDRFFDEIMP